VFLQNHIVNFRNFSLLLKVYFIRIAVSIVSSLKLLSAVSKEYTSKNNISTDKLAQVRVNENSAKHFMLLQDMFFTLLFLKTAFHLFFCLSPIFIPLFSFTVHSFTFMNSLKMSSQYL